MHFSNISFSKCQFLLFTLVLSSSILIFTSGENVPKKKKDVRDMNDAELEKILEQWEEGDDPLEPDELPEHLRPQPKIDLSKLDMTNPDNVLKVTKKGKSIMMFVDVIPELPEDKADDLLRIWQGALHNDHIVAERYKIEKNRAIYMFADGSQAIDAKNFLIEQPEISHVLLDGQTYMGRYSNKENLQNVVDSNAEKTKGKAKIDKVTKPKSEL